MTPTLFIAHLLEEEVAGATAPGGDGGSGRAGLPKKRRRFSSQTATQRAIFGVLGPSALQRRSSAVRSSVAGAVTVGGISTTGGVGRRLIAARVLR